MGKNLLFLAILMWATHSMAKPVVKQEVVDFEGYKVEKAVEEKEGRKLAGEKPSRKHHKKEWKEEESSDSEVRYWQYSE